jgi:cyclase
MRCRVIPCLLLTDGGLYKTMRFERPSYVGDPVNAIRIFNEKEVDELMVLDISASKRGTGPDFGMVEQIAGECFMPLCYGGGVRSVEDARRLFALGVEKVCLQEAALTDPAIIAGIAGRFGSQSVMVSCDVRRGWLGARRMRAASSGKDSRHDWKQFIVNAAGAGAGEILLTAVDRDGTMTGMDLDLIREGAAAVPVPLVAAGGVGSLADIRAAADAGASAVGVGAFFVYHGPRRAVLITYPRPAELRELFPEDTR